MRKKSGNKDQKILDAAIYTFAHKGFANSKISDIADRAGVAVGSVYLYYQDKESILLKIMGEIWKNMYEGLEHIYRKPGEDIKQKILNFVSSVFRTLSENREISMVISHEQNFWMMLKKGLFTEYYDKFHQLVIQMIADGQQQRIIYPDIAPEVIATMLIGGIRYLVYIWQRGELSLEQENLDVAITKILNNGIFKE